MSDINKLSKMVVSHKLTIYVNSSKNFHTFNNRNGLTNKWNPKFYKNKMAIAKTCIKIFSKLRQ